MNIKSLVNNILPLDIRQKLKVEKREKADASADRDPHGQQERGGEPQKRKLTEEELKAAVEHLKGLPGVKDHNLQVRLVSADGVHVVYVEDIKGQVIRRIPESELSQLTIDKDKKKGQILDRAM